MRSGGSGWLVVAALGVSCGGGAPRNATGKATGELSGLVIKGPVSGGTVVAYALDASAKRGAELGRTTTDDSGAFDLALGPYNGALILAVSNGSYTEEAVGLGVKLDGHELTAVLPSYRSGSKVDGVLVTPVSTLATTLATFHVQKRGESLSPALDDAFTHLNAHFGGIDWRSVVPADVTAQSVSNVSPQSTAGLILAGLSFEARLISEASGLTPGLNVNAATLTDALAHDLADGTFDGRGVAGTLSQATYALDGLTPRRFLAQSIAQFVASDRNGSKLTASDVKPLVNAIAGDGDPYLFCAAGQDPSTCAGSPLDIDPPTITWVKPPDGAGVHGQVAVQVKAQDASRIGSFVFKEPAALVSTAATIDDVSHTAELDATLDVSALADGPLTVTVEATDEWKNVARKSVTLQVANHGPQITVSSPNDGSTVKGTISVIASATAQNGQIAKLELVDPPPGMGADQLSAADSFAATWDTTQAPEGPAQLRFHAEDTYGSPTDLVVAVNVDNLPFGQVSVTVSAGAPIQGAGVQILAIDDGTGQPDTARPGGAVLGSGAATDAAGNLAVTLSQENYEGPIQIVASGSNLSYVDPTDGTTPISLPGNFQLSTFIARYTTKDARASAISAPVTLWTTLADAAALAYAHGKNPASLAQRPLSQALAVTDPLFSGHVTKTAAWDVRQVFPALLTQPPPQSLRDVVFAALPDVALNELARDVSAQIGVGPGQVITAPTLVAQLGGQDLPADGMFDGFGAGGVQLQTATTPPYRLTGDMTRVLLATAVDEFILSSQNQTGLTRNDLTNAGVYDTLSLDTSILYSSSEPPTPFDNQGPAISLTVAFTGTDGAAYEPVGPGALVSGTVTVTASATDPSGVKSIAVTGPGGQQLVPLQGNTTSHFSGTWDTTVAADGPLVFTATAVDGRSNTSTGTMSVTVDNTKPAISIVSPTGGYFSATVPVEATASDASGLASFMATGIPGFSDQDGTVQRVFGTWDSSKQGDGPVLVTFIACDVVTNCATASSTVTIDHTGPTVTMNAIPSLTNQSPITVTGTVVDVGSGAKTVTVSGGANGPVTAAVSGGTWSAAIPLAYGSNTLSASATDNLGNVTASPPSGSVNFDNKPPAVTFKADFVDWSGMQHAAPAVQGGVLAAHTLILTATATDNYGVKSLTVSAPGLTGIADPGNTNSKVTATWDLSSVPDGPMTFTATAADVAGNSGTTTFVVIVDNTKPAVTIAAPTAGGWYGAAVPVDVSAADANGITDLTQAGFAGLVDQDAAPAHFVATWVVPASAADGANSATFTACDPVFNCGTATVTVNIDRTAPTLVVNPPPAWTNQSPVVVSGTVSDAGSGVGAMSATVNGSPAPVSRSGSTWSVSIASPNAGANSVVVTAADAVGNAMSKSATAHYDATPPTMSVPPTKQPQYLDEANMVIVAGSPPRFDCSQQPACSVVATDGSSGATGLMFRKAQNRLAWSAGTIKSANDIAAANAWQSGNIPYVYVLAADDQNGSGLAGVTYQSVIGSGAPFAFNGGATIADGSGGYYVPLDSDHMGPALATAASGASLTVTLTATDNAGNASHYSLSFALHVIAPPILVAQDATYASSQGDAENAWLYRYPSGNPSSLSGTKTYDKLWGGTGWFPHGGPRFIHLTLQNIANVPVGVNTGLSGQWEVREQWLNNVYAPPTNVDPDGTTAALSAWWTVSWGSGWSDVSCYAKKMPCGSNAYTSQYDVHFPGTTSDLCLSLPYPTSGTSQSNTSPVKTGGYLQEPYLPGGATPASFTGLGTGGLVVPANTTVDLFIAAPNDNRYAPYNTLTWASFDANGAYSYKTWARDFMRASNTQNTACFAGYYVYRFDRERLAIQMDQASSYWTIGGNVTPSTYALDSTGKTAVGEPGAKSNQLNFTTQFNVVGP